MITIHKTIQKLALALALAIAACTLGLIIALPLQAQVYRTTDADGNVTFTDNKPKDGSGTEVEISPTVTIPATPVRPPAPKTTNESKNSHNTYKSVEITSPGNDDTFHNVESIEVVARSVPAPKAGHKFQLIFDGQIRETSPTPRFTVTNVVRGSHTLKVDLLDANDKVLKSGSPITIHVHRAIQPRPAPLPQN